MKPRVTCDEFESAYVYLVPMIRPGEAVVTHSVDPTRANGMVNVDFDSRERMLGIEVLDAGSLLAREVLAGGGIRVALDRATDIARIQLGPVETSPVRVVPLYEAPDAEGVCFEYAASGRIVAVVVQAASRRLRSELLDALDRDAG